MDGAYMPPAEPLLERDTWGAPPSQSCGSGVCGPNQRIRREADRLRPKSTKGGRTLPSGTCGLIRRSQPRLVQFGLMCCCGF
jgi:hypothetical protein